MNELANIRVNFALNGLAICGKLQTNLRQIGSQSAISQRAKNGFSATNLPLITSKKHICGREICRFRPPKTGFPAPERAKTLTEICKRNSAKTSALELRNCTNLPLFSKKITDFHGRLVNYAYLCNRNIDNLVTQSNDYQHL